MSALEKRYALAREESPQAARLAAYGSLRDDVASFQSGLDGEQELDPQARVRGSSQAGGGIGWLHVDRRDVASIRKRSQRLLRSLDRYLQAHGGPGGRQGKP